MDASGGNRWHQCRCRRDKLGSRRMASREPGDSQLQWTNFCLSRPRVLKNIGYEEEGYFDGLLCIAEHAIKVANAQPAND